MKQQRILRFSCLILLFLCVCYLEAAAGPHLRSMHFAKSLYDSTWGKVLIFSILALSLPFVFYGYTRPYFKSLRTKWALQKLAASDPVYDWEKLQKRFTEIFTRMHQSVSLQNKLEISSMCTPVFWEDHQLPNLIRWNAEGLEHKVQLQKINQMQPILFRYGGYLQSDDPIIIVDFKAEVEDYMAAIATGEVAEGKTGFQQQESIWTFQLNHGRWLLNNIEPSDFRAVYVGMTNEVPKKI